MLYKHLNGVAHIKRKIIQIGASTQLVSLPRSWSKKFNLKKGTDLEVEESGNKLIISTEKAVELNEVNIDVTDMDRTSVLFYIRSAYRKGYDVLNVTYNNPTTVHLRLGQTIRVSSIIHEEVSRLMGVEIVQQKENGCVIKSILEHSGKDFDMILRRIFILLIEMATELARGCASNNKEVLETIKDHHDNITRFISYCLRLLNKYMYERFQEIPTMYYLIACLEDIVDIMKWTARDVIAYPGKLSQQATATIENVILLLQKYYDLFYKFEEPKVTDIYRHRHVILDQIKKPQKKFAPEELIIVNKIGQITELIVNLTQTKMVLEL